MYLYLVTSFVHRTKCTFHRHYQGDFMSKKTIIVVEEIFKTEDEEERLKVLEELFYRVIKQSEFSSN